MKSIASTSNNKWVILFTGSLLILGMNLDFTGLTVAVPTMAHDLHANMTTMQGVVNACLIATGMFTIMGGRLGDIFGYRNIYMFVSPIFSIIRFY